VNGAEDDEIGFEELYSEAGGQLDAVPWASLAPNPALVSWLEDRPVTGSGVALVIGCGYGDDAEELRRHGWEVAAFDIAPTAIARCRERFPNSTVEYRVADLFALPARWHGGFDLVVENRTLQSLPLAQRPAAVSAIARTVRTGGTLWLRCLARADGEPLGRRPWPVSRDDLHGFLRAGFREREFLEVALPAGAGRVFTVTYSAPPPDVGASGSS